MSFQRTTSVTGRSVVTVEQARRHIESFNGDTPPGESTSLLNDDGAEKMKATLDRVRIVNVFRHRSLLVDVLALCFGIGTWLGVNGTFIELPLLVNETPEGWALPSYLSVMVQLGNVGPLAYTLVQKYAPRKLNDACTIYWVLAIGTTCSLLLAFLYKQTAVMLGEPHSVALFALTIGVAFNACTSNVLFMPYMGRFKATYLITYFIGEGLSGLLPSVVALVQGIGTPPECRRVNVTASGAPVYAPYTQPPLFGTQAYFLILFGLMACSCVGYALLNNLQAAKKEHVKASVANGNNYVYETDTSSDTEVRTAQDSNGVMTATQLSSNQYVFLLLLICTISFFSNGVFNSIQSYSCMPYSNHAYHLSATLSVIANPLACFLAMFALTQSLRKLTLLSALAALLTAYVFMTALMSPRPPLLGTSIGSVLVITAWTVLIGVISYTKLAITTIMRAQGGQSLLWVGCLTQVGAFVGSIVIFIAINWLKLFQDAEATTC